MQQLLDFATHNPILVTAFVVLLALLVRSYLVAAAAKNLSNMEAVRLMNQENALLLDVRTAEEFQKAHIANSINIPLGLLESRISEIQNRKDEPVILLCQSGNRSSQAANTLKKHSFEQIYNLSGGMLSWQQANLPIESGAKKKTGKDKHTSKKARQLSENKAVNENKKTETNISSSNTPVDDSDDAGGANGAEEQVSDKIIVYTAGYCPYTTRVKKLLDKKGVEFQQVNVDKDTDIRTEILNRSKQTTFPQIFMGEKHIGNCDELYQLEHDGQLDDILGLKHS